MDANKSESNSVLNNLKVGDDVIKSPFKQKEKIAEYENDEKDVDKEDLLEKGKVSV